MKHNRHLTIILTMLIIAICLPGISAGQDAAVESPSPVAGGSSARSIST